MRTRLTHHRCGATVISCGEVAALCSERVLAGAFETADSAEFVVERVSKAPSGATNLDGSRTPWGSVALEGNRLFAHIPDDVWAAESVLRIAWQVATLRQGGFLMHGCGFAWGPRALAAIGKSTAGKSTLAALSCGHPGHASLLSDEIVQLFPDGRCWGTPFRSNTDKSAIPGPGLLKSLLLLEKGDHEALAPVSPPEALASLLGQLFGSVLDIVPRGEVVQRVMGLVDTVGVHRLTFRKDPAVGPFLKQWVSG